MSDHREFTNPTRKRGLLSCPRLRVGLLSTLLLVTTACQQDMARQPSYRPLEPSDFFEDGRSSRTLVEGTVPWRGGKPSERALVTYRRNPQQADAARAAAFIANPLMNPALLPAISGPAVSEYVNVCPIPIDKKALERGQERFNIYCAVCHDSLGTGNGKIVERGYLPPPNYHLDYSRGLARRGQKVLLREAPLGYFFEVITKGYGGMPDYASQIPPEDRWKIIAYVRVLQRSQWTPLRELAEEHQDLIRRRLASEEERP